MVITIPRCRVLECCVVRWVQGDGHHIGSGAAGNTYGPHQFIRSRCRDPDGRVRRCGVGEADRTWSAPGPSAHRCKGGDPIAEHLVWSRFTGTGDNGADTLAVIRPCFVHRVRQVVVASTAGYVRAVRNTCAIQTTRVGCDAGCSTRASSASINRSSSVHHACAIRASRVGCSASCSTRASSASINRSSSVHYARAVGASRVWCNAGRSARASSASVK